MANKKTDMSKLRQILRLYSQGEKKLKISTLTGVSRNTLKKYLRIYQGLGLYIKDIEMLNDKDLYELFGGSLKPEPGDKYKTLEAMFPVIEKELRRRGITRQILWYRYITENFPFPIHTVRTYRCREFQAQFHWLVENKGMRHVYIKPRFPQLNGKVERSHYTDQEEFYQLLTYTDDVDLNKRLWQKKVPADPDCTLALSALNIK